MSILKALRTKLRGEAGESHKTIIPASPVEHLLVSTDLPSEDERCTIEEHLHELQVLLDTLGDSGGRGSSSKRAIEKERNRIEARIAAHKALLTVIRRVPVEIWQHIFTFGINSKAFLSVSSGIALPTSPWIVSHVCRFWRATTLSLPSLWSHIAILAVEKIHPSLARRVEYLDASLERSAPSPLHVAILCETDDEDLVGHPLITRITKHSARWENACITGLSKYTAPAFSEIRDRLPMLRSLDLYSSITYQQTEEYICDIFEFTPLLKHVRPDLNYTAHLRLPWSQIRTCLNLNCSLATTTDAFTEFKRIERLGTLFLDGSGVIQAPTNTLTTLTHLRLEFTYSGDVDPHPQAVFDHLTLPSLVDVRAMLVKQEFVHSLASMIQRLPTEYPLRTLYIRSGRSFVLWDISSLLKCTPLITHLRVSFTSVEDLWTLVSGVAPLLKFLEIYASLDQIESAITQIRVLVNSRCEPQTSPLIFRIGVSPHESHKAHALLEHAFEKPILLFRGTLPTPKRLLDLKEGLERIYAIASSSGTIDKASTEGILVELEAIDVVDGRDLLFSSAHHALRSLALLHDNLYYGRLKRLRVKERAKAVLDKWNVVLLQDVQSRRWQYQRQTLTYIPKVNDPKTDAQGLTMIYGTEWVFSSDDIAESGTLLIQDDDGFRDDDWNWNW